MFAGLPHGLTRSNANAEDVVSPFKVGATLISKTFELFRASNNFPIFAKTRMSDAKIHLRCVFLPSAYSCVNHVGNPSVRQGLRREGITHVLTQAEPPITHEGYVQIYADRFYRIYRIAPK